MKDALFISWVGMSLVFVGLLALWGMMAVVVKLTNIKKAAPAASESISSIPDKDLGLECKRKAAAAAVTAAMVLMNTSFATSPHREKEVISPWQAAYRTRQNSFNNSLPRRKD
ncbi:MAG: OadG family protein [Pelolinea sp.]|nr:OadG family protein [Pelolinea sp.]